MCEAVDPDLLRPPEAVTQVLDRLEAAGYEAWLVGGCVRDLLRGAPVRDFDIATDAPAQQLLALYPRAIPIGLRHGTVMVPTEAGPVDVTRFRGGGDLGADLAHRDFTMNALACRPGRGLVVDPFSGQRDFEAGRLRAVGSAADRIAEDPLRALRAARFVATLSLSPDADLERALGDAADGLTRVARERIRDEIQRLLLGPDVEAGLALLARTGLAAELASDVRADAPAVVAALPPDLSLRLAGWLRGTRVSRVLARTGFGPTRAREVERLLFEHPVDERTDPDAAVAVRRLLARVGDEGFERLATLRRAELDQGNGSTETLDALGAAVERVKRDAHLALERAQLAIDGAGVMATLGCRPGPQVGRALAWLTEQAIADPGVNTLDGLQRLLHRFAEEEADAS